MNTGTSKSGRVISVNISSDKGTSKMPVPEIRINRLGVEGDAHAGDWHRQVSLLGMESIDRFAAASGRIFACGDFAENITTHGIDLTAVAVMDRFTMGAVELEVTQLGKKCHGDGCAIFQQVGKCVMPKEGIFCRVIREGAVKPGDAIVYSPRPLRVLVITLSDRASQGVYEDLSGPRVCHHVENYCVQKQWRPQIESVVMPDDADRLRTALLAARDRGMDVVVTTGGTGVGPRDITPEVVMSLADKLIPGIMEHIRLTFGAQKPYALLSRSVAAILGQTVVYTLPGSVRAVDEYMGEIVKTLDHVIFTVNGLDTH